MKDLIEKFEREVIVMKENVSKLTQEKDANRPIHLDEINGMKSNHSTELAVWWVCAGGMEKKFREHDFNLKKSNRDYARNLSFAWKMSVKNSKF